MERKISKKPFEIEYYKSRHDSLQVKAAGRESASLLKYIKIDLIMFIQFVVSKWSKSLFFEIDITYITDGIWKKRQCLAEIRCLLSLYQIGLK